MSSSPVVLRVRSRALAVAALGLALGLAGCRKPAAQTPEGTLGLLRDALANPSAPLDRLVDSRVMTEALMLARAHNIEASMGVSLREGALPTMLGDYRERLEPRRYFADARTYLRPGSCERVAEARLPETIRTTPAPARGWPREALELQESVARRLTNAFAGDYRCGDGPTFRAVFVRPNPDDGTLRVAYVGSEARAH